MAHKVPWFSIPVTPANELEVRYHVPGDEEGIEIINAGPEILRLRTDLHDPTCKIEIPRKHWLASWVVPMNAEKTDGTKVKGAVLLHRYAMDGEHTRHAGLGFPAEEHHDIAGRLRTIAGALRTVMYPAPFVVNLWSSSAPIYPTLNPKTEE